MRSEVNVKVKVTTKWYAPLRYPKMNPHTNIGIPTTNDIRYAPDTIILETRS